MIKLLLALLASLTFTYAYADADADADKVKARLKKNYTEFENVEQVYKTDIMNLYEVVMGGRLFYTDEKAEYFVNGVIFDLKTKRNLTDERSRKLFAVDFDKLPFELAIKKVKGNGQRKMAYFTDPNCGFCKKLEEELKSVDNITLHLFLLTIFNGSEEKVRGVLCSKNPIQAWDDLMLNDKQPPAGKCETHTAKTMEFSNKLNVTGTPALIFANGEIVPGYMPAAEIEKALNGTSGK